MSNETTSPSNINDPYRHVGLVLNPDGTLTRLRNIPNTAPSLGTSVLTKDLTINPSNKTWLRLFLPRTALSSNPNKLPLIVFFHGSGFIVASASSTMFHDLCVHIAETVNAVVASVDYRLAPEHRLPAAYDDATEALAWIRTSDEEWLTRHVDYSSCFLMGNSAGATIAYFAGLRAAEKARDLEPLKIKGLIVRQPFFGGSERTESELRLENDANLPLCVTDMLWELALPRGVGKEHEYCNVKGGSEKLEMVKELGWRVLVSANEGDPMVDRAKELVALLKEKGVKVVCDFDEEGYHGVEHSDPSKEKRLLRVLKDFVYSSHA
ncbi:carboxylesterase 1-like [Abrus precatorius]|uniref:Carboxylesterase 1-like n=1 Tax=Abrus precatorius TaxID=3816 RepID=A0A8B8LS34_ABRPR|nr:carboxylesterase 1-like [Abrus precatorius]